MLVLLCCRCTVVCLTDGCVSRFAVHCCSDPKVYEVQRVFTGTKEAWLDSVDKMTVGWVSHMLLLLLLRAAPLYPSPALRQLLASYSWAPAGAVASQCTDWVWLPLLLSANMSTCKNLPPEWCKPFWFIVLC
jgi:hypothetical protein